MPGPNDHPGQPAPSSTEADTLIPELRILPLRFRIQSKDLSLDFFSGPLWRSGFGLALFDFPAVFNLLFAQTDKELRLYSIQPPGGKLSPGDSFELGLSLFGPACDHAMACTQAIARLGELGLGEKRGKYVLVEASVADSGAPPFFTADTGLVAKPAPVAAQTWLERTFGSIQELHLDLLTPLHVKIRGQRLTHPPEFKLLVRLLHDRLDKLCRHTTERNPVPLATRIEQERIATTIHLDPTAPCSTRETRVKRRSTGNGNMMNAAAQTGSLYYRGNLTPFMGLLTLARNLNLGSKTALGFGCFNIRTGQSQEPDLDDRPR